MSPIFALLFFVSIATVVESSPLSSAPDKGFRIPQLAGCGRYGIMRPYGSDCWKQCSTYDIKTPVGCLNIVVSARCQCNGGYIIDDSAGGECVLPEDCKKYSKNKKKSLEKMIKKS